MTRQILMVVLIGCFTVANVQGTEPEAAPIDGELKKLEGNWKLIRSEYKGNLRSLGNAKEGVFFEGDKMMVTDDGRAWGATGDVKVDGGKTPKTIDVEITRGSDIGRTMLGIYEIRDGKLSICWSEPGEEKRPTKFTTKISVGSGATLDTFQLVKQQGTPTFERTSAASLADGAAEKKTADEPAPIDGELKKLEGNWKLIRFEYKGNLRSLGNAKEGVFFEDDKMVITDDGRASGAIGDVKVDGGKMPKTIDVEITRGSDIGQTMLGIYEIRDGRLSICWNEPGDEKRPTKFATKISVGAGAIFQTFQFVKDEGAALPSGAAQVANGADAAAGKEATATEDPAGEAKKLEGNWKLVRRESKGILRPTSESYPESIFFEDDKIVWTQEGRGRDRGEIILYPDTNPKAIDVEIRHGSNLGDTMLGIYEQRGNKLTICFNEPGVPKRPTKFVTKLSIGSGATLETFEAVDDVDKIGEAQGKIAKPNVAIDPAVEMKKLEGNWVLTRRETKGVPQHVIERLKEGLFIEDGKIYWMRDNHAGDRGNLTVDPTTSPTSMEIEMTRGSYNGEKVLAIYDLTGDKLTICSMEPGDTKPPQKFLSRIAVGSGARLETYQRQKN